jgi:ribosomal protein L12E/L44/L45/RPP1/RPP2
MKRRGQTHTERRYVKIDYILSANVSVARAPIGASAAAGADEDDEDGAGSDVDEEEEEGLDDDSADSTWDDET